jgi:hypothetical protein
VRFEATIRLEGKTATGIPVPADVVEALGKGKRPPVVVTVGGHSYRSTVAAYGDVFMLPLAAEHREAASVEAGDTVEVEVELDTAPRTVDVPDDLAAALAAAPGARRAFDASSTSERRRIVLAVEGAKKPETRTRRIDRAVEELTTGGKA